MNRLASTADITSGLQLGRADLLRSLRSFLNMDRPDYHSTDCLKERGVEKGSAQQTLVLFCEQTLRRLQRDGAEQNLYGPFSPEYYDAILSRN